MAGKTLLLAAALAGVLLHGQPAGGAESGTGLYLLGYQSSLAGCLPGPGVYLRYDLYWYQGNARALPFSGRVEVELRSRAILHVVALTYVTPLKILGANCALGVIVPAGNVFLKGKVEILQRFSLAREADRWGLGDLAVSPLVLGWHLGNFHLLANGTFYAPTGSYDPKRRLNVGLNRWAVEPNLAVTWLAPRRGQEASVALGYTINFRNPDTDYTTGQELHAEFFLGQQLFRGLTLGLAGYLYQQVTGDRGAGARLGKFHGQTFALGPCLKYDGKIAGHPLGLNARYYNELAVRNRMDGQSLFFTLSLGF